MEQELDRVDTLVKSLFPSLSRRQIEEAIESGLVIGAGGNRLKKGERLPTDQVQCRRLAEQLEVLARGDRSLPVKIVAEEADFVIVDKPAGMPSEPRSLFDVRTVTNWAIARYPRLKEDFPEPQPTVTPFPVEADISGLVVVAKSRAGFELWKGRFDRQEVTLSYLAWCWGEPKPHRFFISIPIGGAPGDPARRVAVTEGTPFDPPARDAVTVVRTMQVVKRGGKGLFLSELQVATNVVHQVRVHMASKGYPVVGDTVYDPESTLRAERPAYYQLMIYELAHGGRRAEARSDKFRGAYT